VIEAYEFLSPTLLVAELQILFAHTKQQWKTIQVGFHGSQVCFILTKKNANWENFTPSGKQTITITHEIPQGFKIKEKVDTLDWKGVSLEQAEFEEKQTPFDIS
jgi:hypothetical protein